MTNCPICLKGKLVSSGKLSVKNPTTKQHRQHSVNVLKCNKCGYSRVTR
jgi:hypothetical protein